MNLDIEQINVDELRALSEEDKKKIYQQLSGSDKKKLKSLLYSNKPLPSKEIAALTEIFRATADATSRYEYISTESAKLFEVMRNPFAEFLSMYKTMVDVHVASTNTMAGEFLKSFGQWLEGKENKEELYGKYCNQEFKHTVLLTMTAYHTAQIEMAQAIFRIEKEEITRAIKDRIRKFISLGKYKEAMALSEQFEMNKTWTFEAYLLPRLLQDSNGYSAVKEHCKGIPKLERALVECLDGLIFNDNNKKIREMGARYEPHIRLDKGLEYLSMISVKKKVKDLLEYYKKEADVNSWAPQYAWKCRESEIIYAMRQRFQEKTLSHASYVSKVKCFLENTTDSRKEYVVKLIWFKKEIPQEERQQDAVAWFIIYNLEPSFLPQPMQYYMSNNPQLVEKIRKQVFTERPRETLVNLTMNGKKIIFVDDLKALDALSVKLKEEELIGFDSETVPELILPSKLALLQISISNGIYLVDFYKFISEKMMSNETKDNFLSALLLSNGLKLGFDITNDLNYMPIQGRVQNNNCLCLKRFLETIIETDPEFFDLSQGDGKISIKLSTICERLLGVELDKTQQQSNWALRPLEEKQMYYAAQDADILLLLYEKMKEMIRERHLDLNDLLQRSMTTTVTKQAKNKELKRRLETMTWAEYVDLFNSSSSSRLPFDISVGLDLMLLGSVKPLRRCGISAKTPDTHMDLVHQARRDPKMILFTSGKAFDRLNYEFPGRVVYLPAESNALQQMTTIMKKLDVRLSKEDVYTRCRECNHFGFVVAPSPVIQALHYRNVICAQLYYSGKVDMTTWRKVLGEVNPNDYEGYGCKVDPNEDYFQVNLYRGRIDIIRNLYIWQWGDEWRSTDIAHVPESACSVPGRLFYLCAGCGKFFYE